jgi:hypothetical protein
MYQCRCKPFAGHRYAEIMPQARKLFRTIQRRTKRRPYVRAAYFKKDKVFFDYFWIHLNQKSVHDRARRLKYFPCALELIAKSTVEPLTFIEINPTRV